jgi:hypothetical protein
MYGADNLPKEGATINCDHYDGKKLDDHSLYQFIGISGDSDGNHSIAALKKGHSDEWYRYYIICKFNKYGKVINQHEQSGYSFSSGPGYSEESQQCKDLQELYNKFNETYLGELALNRKQRRGDLAVVEEDLIAAKKEQRRIDDRIAHLERAYRLIRDSLPNSQ